MIVRRLCDAPASRRAAEKAYLHEIRLVNVLDRDRLLSDRRGKRLKPDRTPAVKSDYNLKHPSVNIVKSEAVDLKTAECIIGDPAVDNTVAFDLCKVADALEQAVCDTRRSSRSRRDLSRTVFIDRYLKYSRAAPDYRRKVLNAVKLQLQHHTEPVAERR